MKIISVIIATYNADKTLERCLESILKQKTDEIELIIVDGGSKDDTINIVDKYKKNIDAYISESDQGIYDAWNKGVKIATGKWIVFLGADDMLIDDFFDFYLNYISSHDLQNIDIVSAQANITDIDGNFMYTLGEPYSWKAFRWRMNISHGSTLHNAKIFKELGKFSLNYKICGDYEFLLRKRLKAEFCNRAMIVMQFGGMSNSYKGLIDSYRVRRDRKSVPLILNIGVLLRGFLSLSFHKLKG